MICQDRLGTKLKKAPTRGGVFKQWDTMDYIDSPVSYNDFMGKPYWRKWPNGSYHTEQIDPANPATCGEHRSIGLFEHMFKRLFCDATFS